MLLEVWRQPPLIALATMLLAACGTAPLAPPPEESPIFQRIDARVGIAYPAAARSATFTNPLLRIEVGKTSVARFERVFAAMFTQPAELPAWPPWRVAKNSVDGVIELERTDAELVLGNDANRPDVVSIAYRVCLYEPDGALIRCWSPSASLSHQRGVGECLDLRECLVPQTESVMRAAIARFLVEAESDSALRAWSARLPRPVRAP
ncbi:MAG: hypothetical protein K9J76_04250 [Polaromonas sp.]|nr:hypothetical protein [Polaromonas sp.]